jgi:hypothetical protein
MVPTAADVSNGLNRLNKEAAEVGSLTQHDLGMAGGRLRPLTLVAEGLIH